MSENSLQEDPLGQISRDPPAPSSVGTEQVSTKYNMRSPAVKRIMREASEMSQHDKTILDARPLEDNIFEWHFTFRGPPETVYARGIYHGRLILPSQYPMAPPEIVMLTPSGRFETGTRICLSISNYHPETWQPSWSIRTAIVALQSFMATNSPGAIGSVECADNVRMALANSSTQFECVECGIVEKLLDPIAVPETQPAPPAPAGPQAVLKFGMPRRGSEIEEGRDIREDGTDDRAGDTGRNVPAVAEPNDINAPEVDEGVEAGVMDQPNEYFPPQTRSDNLAWAIGIVGTIIVAIIFRRIYSFNYPDD